MEKIIIRREYNPYTKQWGYLVGFPEEKANFGKIGCFACHFNTYNKLVLEPYCEVDTFYFLKKKIVHKNTEDAQIVCSELEKMIDKKFQVVEKIPKKGIPWVR